MEVPGERTDEVLVLLREADQRTVDQLRGAAQVRQVFSPRLVVVAAGPGDVETLRRHPDVRTVTSGPPPEDVLAELDRWEALLVRGWSERAALQTRQRRGDGEPWDAPGRQPPDRPA